MRLAPPIRFVVLFIAIALALLALLSGPLAPVVQPPLCHAAAAPTRAVLRCLGQDASGTGRVVATPEHSFVVVYACTSLPATVLFVSAVAAFPAAAIWKLGGIFAGVLILYAVNIVRLVVLFFVKAHHPELYERVHLAVWQSVLVILAVALFLGWAALASRGRDDVPG